MEEEVAVEEEEERGAKRATSRFRDCSDTIRELPATCNNAQIWESLTSL